MWNYLDRRRAIVTALKDYGGVKFVIDPYRDKLKLVEERIVDASLSYYGFSPSNSKRDNSTERRLLHGIDQTAKLNERYQQTQLYLEWFEPAWRELSDDERFVLDVYYRTPN